MSELEIKKLQAEEAKLRAEAAKLEAETKALGSVGQRMFRGLGNVTAGLIAIASVVAGFATHQLNEAKNENAQLRLEQSKRQLNDAEARLSAAQDELIIREAALVEKRRALLETESSLLEVNVEFVEVNERLAALKQTPGISEAVRNEIQKTVERQQTLSSNVQLAAGKAGAASHAPDSQPLVIIFAPPADTTSPAVVGAAKMLEEAAFQLSRRRIYSGPPPKGVTEIRYFRPSDADEATRILEALKSKARLVSGRTSYVIDPDIRRARYFEVRLVSKAFAPT